MYNLENHKSFSVFVNNTVNALYLACLQLLCIFINVIYMQQLLYDHNDTLVCMLSYKQLFTLYFLDNVVVFEINVM